MVPAAAVAVAVAVPVVVVELVNRVDCCSEVTEALQGLEVELAAAVAQVAQVALEAKVAVAVAPSR